MHSSKLYVQNLIYQQTQKFAIANPPLITIIQLYMIHEKYCM